VLVIGMERHAEQPLLGAGPAVDERLDGEEGRREQHAVLDDADAAGLLEHEDAVRVERRRRHEERCFEPARDPDGMDRRARGRRYALANRGRVLELTARRAPVAVYGIAVVALFGASRDAVATDGRRAVRRRGRVLGL